MVKIIALITTKGNRCIYNSIKSILDQTRKPDDIFIASEIKINKINNIKILVNPYSPGLARNTMQALSKIYLQYSQDDVYIATLDDDDIWYKNWIELAEVKISKNENFISGYLDVYQEEKYIETYKFNKSDIKKETFIYENPGIQGSNKVFNLKLALESGGMQKNINAATDRSFNINLISHPKVKLGIVKKPVCRFNKDTKRERISLDKNRLKDLERFYRQYYPLIDKTKIEKINKRHFNLHGFKDVIKWK